MNHGAVAEIIRANLPRLTKSEARIARYILNNEAQIGLETGSSLAAATQVSEITVSRFMRKIGFRGIRELKDKLKLTRSETTIESTERVMRLLSGSDSAMIESESGAIRKLSLQLARPEWRQLIDQMANADRIFVTGFQTVKGVAEDFARRLGVVRDAVRFISVHDGGLIEWVPPADSIDGKQNLLVLVDIMPYARESEKTCSIACRRGFRVIVFTDEYNNWAYGHTDLVFHAESKTGLFLDSTASLTSILNFAIHAVGECNPAQARTRIDNWMLTTMELDLF